MSVEWFFKLKEFDSLTKSRNDHLKAQIEQENRLLSLNGKRQDAILQTEKLKQNLHSLQQKLFETEKQLKLFEAQLTHLKERGGDENKIRSYEQQIEHYENEGLNLLDEIQLQQNEMNDVKVFSTGLEKTFLEIQAEVVEEQAKQQVAIGHIELRLKLIEEELPPDFRVLLKRTLAKNLAIGPFTRVESGSCYFCHSKISRTEESEIDHHQKLKTCPQCERIFLPYGA